MFLITRHTNKVLVLRHSPWVCVSASSIYSSTHSTVLVLACTDAVDAYHTCLGLARTVYDRIYDRIYGPSTYTDTLPRAHVEHQFFYRHRADLQDHCCKVCWTPHRKERTDEVESDHEQGMFQSSTYIHTYHWDCLIKLGCYHNHDAHLSTGVSLRGFASIEWCRAQNNILSYLMPIMFTLSAILFFLSWLFITHYSMGGWRYLAGAIVAFADRWGRLVAPFIKLPGEQHNFVHEISATEHDILLLQSDIFWICGQSLAVISWCLCNAQPTEYPYCGPPAWMVARDGASS